MRMDFFLICCSVAFLQQFLSHENSPGGTLSVLVPTCNKKVVQSLNYLFELLTVLLSPYRGLSVSPEPCPHQLRQQPGASPQCRRGICSTGVEGQHGSSSVCSGHPSAEPPAGRRIAPVPATARSCPGDSIACGGRTPFPAQTAGLCAHRARGAGAG